MANIAKIQLTIRHCSDCPYAVKRSEYAGWFCIHDMQRVGLSVGDGQDVPDFCPFVLAALQRIVDELEQSGGYQALPLHGQHFLEDCISLGFNSPDYVQKQTLLLKIAMLLQYNFFPSSQADYLEKLQNSGALNSEDATVISSALACLTSPFPANLRPEKDTLVSAALVLATAIKKTTWRRPVLSVEYTLYQHLDSRPALAELRYTIGDDFNLTKFISDSPELLRTPRQIACTFLGISQFRFFVNDTEVELAPLLGD